MNAKRRRQTARLAPEARGPGAAGGKLARSLAAAARARAAGRLDQAETLYRRVLGNAPEQPEALHWLGVLEHSHGRGEAALALLERAAAGRPDDGQCLYHLGEVRRALGRNEAAVASYRQALARQPEVADIHFGLGTALLDLGRAEAAADALRNAVRLAPGDAQAHNNLANALAVCAEPDAAAAHYRLALSLQPGYAEAHMNLGLLLVRGDRDREAEGCFGAAVAADPDLLEARLALARCLLRLERAEDALEVAREAVRRRPEQAEAQHTLGRCLGRLVRMEEALESYRRAVALEPDFAEAHFNIGVCLQSLGRFGPAVEAHERALALRPDLAEAHYNLALIKREQPGDGEAARLRALLAEPDLDQAARVNGCFALGKLLEDRGDAEGAFAHYRRGNALKAPTAAFDAARHVDYVDRLIAEFDAGFFAARRGWGDGSGLPVFVLGMPRSGTTLVEQILASHPAVHGAGELDELRHMVDRLPARLDSARPFPECAAELAPALAGTLAGEYLERLRRHAPGAGQITDKMTGNYLRLGLIALLLPGAKVVHCRRDPLDTCVSCYFQNFAHGLGFTYDLGHLGLVYRQYERLMAHWRQVLPLAMLELSYEAMIADQEATTRRLLAFCGLPWDARCLAFHEQARQVRTASFWQVRQPIYSTSIGRWRAFESHLEPLFEALGTSGRAGE